MLTVNKDFTYYWRAFFLTCIIQKFDYHAKKSRHRHKIYTHRFLIILLKLNNLKLIHTVAYMKSQFEYHFIKSNYNLMNRQTDILYFLKELEIINKSIKQVFDAFFMSE